MCEALKRLKEITSSIEGTFLKLCYHGKRESSAAEIIRQEMYDNGLDLVEFNPDVLSILAKFPGDSLVWITDSQALANEARQGGAVATEVIVKANQGFLIGTNPKRGMLVLLLQS